MQHYVEKGVLYKVKGSVAAALPEIRKIARAYVEKHNAGYASQSVFSIVVDLMLQSGDLSAVKGNDSQSQIPAEIRDFIEKAESGKISTFELRRRYLSDRNFRNSYDQHTGLAAFATPQPIQLTADEYHRIPSRTAQARYQRDPAFKAAVDKLFAAGRV